MGNHITGDFLYIDCDTVIADDIEELTGLDIDIGAALNFHCGINKHGPLIRRWIQQRDKRLGFESSLKTNKHFNGGVIFCKDTAVCHKFFEKWHSLWLYSNSMGCTEDLSSFNQTDFLFNGIITELDGIWNCQICSPGMLPYLCGSEIIHYFISGKSQQGFYRLAESAVFEKIKETGRVSISSIHISNVTIQSWRDLRIFLVL
jgi:lipopolysaccharide biosynthesis glycosyltransferase